MKLLTAGCSFTKDNFQFTWADYLAKKINCELINAGARGAGIDFVAKTTIYHCYKYKPNLVVLMLPSIDRFDWYVDKNYLLKNEDLKMASWQNGVEPTFKNIDGSLSFDEGYALTGGEIRGNKKYWYKYYYSETFAFINYWFTVFNLENFFKQEKINYFFTLAYDKNNMVEQEYNKTGLVDNYQFIMDKIDWSKFIFYKEHFGFLNFVKNNRFPTIKNHPVTEAHESWVDLILRPLYEF